MSIIVPSAPTRRRVRSSSAREERRKPGRPRRGNIKTWETKSGDVGYGVRFVDQEGVRRYERCGLASEGWNVERAYAALDQYLDDVRRGVFRPTESIPSITHSDPLFDDFAREYLAEHAIEIKERTDEAYESNWRLHLSPVFGHLRLSEITYERIYQFKLDQVRLSKQLERAEERGVRIRGTDGRKMSLSPRTINHRISTLSLILGNAVRRQSIAIRFNPAASADLRVKVPRKTVRDWLEADELMLLFEAAQRVGCGVRPETLRKAERVREMRARGMTERQVASELGMSVGGVHWLSNRYAPTGPSGLRTAVCLLGASGARNTEICLLRPTDLDFVHGKIRVRRSKTSRGVREIDMTPWLQRQLESYVASLGEDYPSDAPLIPNCHGTFYNKDSLNRRLKAIQREATVMCVERRLPSLPTRLTGHVFRRTYITLMLEAGAPPSYVQEQVGHEDASTTLNIYARVLRNRERRSFGRAFDELMTGAVPESPFERGGEQRPQLRLV